MSDHDPLRTDITQASGWYAILPEPKPVNRLKGQQVADWVVIGAGVTGLAAARRLGELDPGARVVLLESHRLGYGSAGRNAGFIIDTPHLTEELGPEANRIVSRLVIAGRNELEAQVKNYDIECDWSPIGHLTACVSEKRVSHLHHTQKTLEASNEPYEWYDKDALANIIGTDHYHAAVLTPRTVLINPAAMFRGIGENLPDNVELFEESPVRRINPGSPFTIECAEGSVTAKNILLTNNAHVAELGYLKNKVFPLVACASLSRPLTDKEQAAMGGAPEWGLTGVATLRRTKSNRILVRHGMYYTGNFRLSDSQRRELIASHRKGFLERYPMLDTLEFEQTWSGVYCMTWGWASHFGRLEPGVYAALGYCGVGVARGTISGKLLAEYAMGSDSDLLRDVQSLSTPRRLPPQPFLGIGIHARLKKYLWDTRTEW